MIGRIFVGEKMKYIKLYTILVGMILLCSCGKQEKPAKQEEHLSSDEMYLYYTNNQMTDVEREVSRIPSDNDVVKKVDEIISKLISQQTTKEYQSPIPDGIEYQKTLYDKHHKKATIEFNVLYDEVDADALLMFKVCVVKTLLQFEEINVVALSLQDANHMDPDALAVVENFDEDSFVMSFSNKYAYEQNGNITIYFANESGEQLKEYHQSDKISNNSSLAELVIQTLIEGPKQEGFLAVIPPETTIRNILVKDGICYVDFSDEFYDTDNPMKNDIIVYAIVNSLVELPTISKVQFLKNGEKQTFFRETMPFDGLFERNLDLIEADKVRVEDEQNEAVEEKKE